MKGLDSSLEEVEPDSVTHPKKKKSRPAKQSDDSKDNTTLQLNMCSIIMVYYLIYEQLKQ